MTVDTSNEILGRGETRHVEHFHLSTLATYDVGLAVQPPGIPPYSSKNSIPSLMLESAGPKRIVVQAPLGLLSHVLLSPEPRISIII